MLHLEELRVQVPRQRLQPGPQVPVTVLPIQGRRSGLETHLSEIPGNRDDELQRSLVDEALLRQHELTPLVFKLEKDGVVCGEKGGREQGETLSPLDPLTPAPTN